MSIFPFVCSVLNTGRPARSTGKLEESKEKGRSQVLMKNSACRLKSL